MMSFCLTAARDYMKKFGYTLLKKRCYTPEWATFLAIIHILSVCEVKIRMVGGFMFFLCIVCTILFNVHFGKFVMTFIDIGEIGCMIIPKCHWMVIMVNVVKRTWFFCMMLTVCVVLCMPDQYWVFPPLAAIIAARRRGMLDTRRCRRSVGISARLSSRAWQSSPRFLDGLSIPVTARPNSSQIWSMGLQSGDLAGCSILVTLPCWRKSRTTPAQ